VRQDIQDEIAGIEEKIRDLSRHTIDWLEEASNLVKLCRQADKMFFKGTAEQKQALINSVASNLFLKDGNVGFTYKKPFDAIIEGNESQDWLPGLVPYALRATDYLSARLEIFLQGLRDQPLICKSFTRSRL